MLDVRIGSVGDSSAPSRNASVQLSPTIVRPASATSERGDGHRDEELAQRQVPLALKHLALDLEAVAEEDHDQRRIRQIPTNPDWALKEIQRKPPSPTAKPTSTNRAVSDMKLRRASPDSSAPAINSPPSTATVAWKVGISLDWQLSLCSD